MAKRIGTVAGLGIIAIAGYVIVKLMGGVPTVDSTPSAASQPPGSPHWTYAAKADEMAGKPMRTATIQSSAPFNLKPPYEGPQHATLTVREHPRNGRDVALSIESGQIICGAIECEIPVRFDQEPATNFTATRAADLSTTSVYFRDYLQFTKRLAGAKTVRFEPTLYQNGQVALAFNVAGFDRNALAKAQ